MTRQPIFRQSGIAYFLLISIAIGYCTSQTTTVSAATVITAFDNTNQLIAQEYCQSERNRGAFESALEWGRSGLFSNRKEINNEIFRSANIFLLRCINAAKQGIKRNNGNNAAPTLLSAADTADYNLTYLLDQAGPDRLSRVAEVFLNAGELETASLLLSAALERSRAPRGVERENVYWKRPDMNWVNELRTTLANVEFQLGAFQSAARRSDYDLRLRQAQNAGGNLTLPKAVLGKALLAQGSWDAASVHHMDIFNELKNTSMKQVRFSLYERSQNTTDQVATQLELLIRSIFRQTEKTATDINLAFEAAQMTSVGDVSAAYEDLAARAGLSNRVSRFRVKKFQRDRDAYDDELDKLEQSLLSAHLHKEPIAQEQIAEFERLSVLRVKLHTQAQTLSADDSAGSGDYLPVSVSDVQERLSENQTLIFYSELPAFEALDADILVWIISRDRVDWKSVGISAGQAQEMISTLRCGLDGGVASSDQCLSEYEAVPGSSVAQPPFNLQLSASMFERFIPVADTDALAENLIIVPSQSLIGLPFTALRFASQGLPEFATDFKSLQIPWLVGEHSLQILPSMSGLLPTSVPSNQTDSDGHTLLSFGNPLLLGDPARYPSHEFWAETVRLEQQCQHLEKVAVSDYYVDEGLVDQPSDISPASLLRLSPLVQSRLEICNFARDISPSLALVFLGDDAREGVIKTLNDRDELVDYSILHFASHALLQSDIPGIDEPGIVFTPPEKANGYDDGFLRSSEIAKLNLEAKLVVLSACNTANGGEQSDQALAGLARAFFLAGAETLIVSQWAANSDTSAVIFSLMAKYSAENGLTLRSLTYAIQALAINARAHPATWAQFVAVGSDIS